MFFRSPVLLFDKSKRLAVKLASSVGTGFAYWTEKSPLKKDIRMALRKYDPLVNRHVMFYEVALGKPRRGKAKRPSQFSRWTGIGIEDMVKKVARTHEKKVNSWSLALGMSQGPAAQLLRHAAAAPGKRELWRRALAALPEASGESMQELAAIDALRRHLHGGDRDAPLSPILLERLRSADAVPLVHAAKAYATLRVRDQPVLLALQRRSSELAVSWQLKGRALAELTDHLGKLASRGDAAGRRARGAQVEAWKVLAWKSLAHQLGDLFVANGRFMRLIDLAVGLGGLARLGTSAEVLQPLQEHVLAALQGRVSDGACPDRSQPDPRHVATLVASYAAFARLKHRDDVVLEACGAALELGWMWIGMYCIQKTEVVYFFRAGFPLICFSHFTYEGA
eukprot:symbB.v1.2.030492.t1/scaffold3435.1/size56750/2